MEDGKQDRVGRFYRRHGVFTPMNDFARRLVSGTQQVQLGGHEPKIEDLTEPESTVMQHSVDDSELLAVTVSVPQQEKPTSDKVDYQCPYGYVKGDARCQKVPGLERNTGVSLHYCDGCR
jgi:hypothetical protein